MVWLNIHHPANIKVLLTLGNGHRDHVTIMPAESTDTPSKTIQRLWNELGKTLPEDSRCRLNDAPALVHPASGLVLAVGIGGDYALRLPPGLMREAEQLGLRRTSAKSARPLDVQTRFGADWLLGNWQPREIAWLRRLYRFHDEVPMSSGVR